MAKLSDEETAMLKRLTDKQKAPDSAPIGRSINVTIDLGDEEQIKRAIKHGFLTADDVADEKGEDEDEGDEVPRRKGYFQ